MIELKIPYPDPKLNPNNTTCWQGKLSAKKKSNEMGFYLVKHYIKSHDFTNKDKFVRQLEVYLPDKRKRDDDNIFAAFKNIFDGIFKALGLDDSAVFKSQIIRCGIDKHDPHVIFKLAKINVEIITSQNKIFYKYE